MPDTAIKQQIDRLLGVRDDIGDALTETGVTVPANMKMADVPDLIISIMNIVNLTTEDGDTLITEDGDTIQGVIWR